MHTLGDCTEGEAVGTRGAERATPGRITTTLYDLVAALQTVVAPDEDALVVATVAHWLHSGRITCLGHHR